MGERSVFVIVLDRSAAFYIRAQDTARAWAAAMGAALEARVAAGTAGPGVLEALRGTPWRWYRSALWDGGAAEQRAVAPVPHHGVQTFVFGGQSGTLGRLLALRRAGGLRCAVADLDDDCEANARILVDRMWAELRAGALEDEEFELFRNMELAVMGGDDDAEGLQFVPTRGWARLVAEEKNASEPA